MTEERMDRFHELVRRTYKYRTMGEDAELSELESEYAALPLSIEHLGEVEAPSLSPKILKARAVRTHNGLLMVNEFGDDQFLLHMVPNNKDGVMLWVSREELGAWMNAMDTVSTRDTE